MADSGFSPFVPLHTLSTISVLLLLLLVELPTGAVSTANVLLSGESLGAGGRLAYRDHSFTLTDKCNLELDDGVWQSDTVGHGRGCRLTLESDGRLVVRSEDGAIVWVSHGGPQRKGEHIAVLEPRGRVTVYGPAVWSALELGGHQLRGKLGCLKGGKWDNCLVGGDIDRQDFATPPLLLSHDGRRLPPQKLSCLHSGKWDNCIINGGVPAAGDAFFSGSGRFRLRGGCGGLGRCFLRLDDMGGLALVDDEDRAIWTNQVRSSPGEYVAVLRRDGGIAVYGPTVWSTSGGAVEHQRPRGAATNVNRKIGTVRMVTDGGP